MAFTSVALGQNSWLRPADETSYNYLPTPQSLPDSSVKGLWLDQNGDNLDEESNRLESEAVAPLGSAMEYSVLGTLNAKGSITCEVPINGFEMFLKYGLGLWAVSGTGPFTHTFKVADLIAPNTFGTSPVAGAAFTLWLNRGMTDADLGTGAFWQYFGGLVNSIEFSLSKGKNLTATVDMMFAGAKPYTGAWQGVSPTFPSGSDLGYFNYVLSGFFYGGSQIPIYDWRLKIENNLDGDHFMTAPGDWDMRAGAGGIMNPWRRRSKPLRNRKVAVTTTFQAEFDRMDIYDDWAANTYRGMRMVCANAAGDRTTTSENEGYTGAASALVTQYKPQITNEGKIMSKTDVKYYRKIDGTDNELEVRLVNGNKMAP